MGNRLRADLLAVFPAAIDIAGGDLGAPGVPAAAGALAPRRELAAASRDEIVGVRPRRPARLARPVRRPGHRRHGRAPAARPGPAGPGQGRAIRLAAAQLLALRAQRRAWERRMGELLLGGPRSGRDKTPKDPDPGKAFPGGEIYLSMPGLGDRLAARVAGEIGEHFEQFTTPNALQCYAGRAPVTRRSGRSEFTIARRLAYNRHLGEAVQQWAFCSLTRPPGPASSTTPRSPPAKSHHAALRALGNRWLEVLWHCLRKASATTRPSTPPTATAPSERRLRLTEGVS